MRSLFDPVKIGSIEIKNRLMMTAMGTSYATNDGCCTEQLSDYWEARAKGGWGLIITELCRINAETLGNDMGLFKDEQIPVDIALILGNLITVIFDYQILRKPLKILSL